MKFSLCGDSGSFVVNKSGMICGLYYDTTTSWASSVGMEVVHPNAGLAMTMADVIEGIKSRLGVDQETIVSLLKWQYY